MVCEGFSRNAHMRFPCRAQVLPHGHRKNGRAQSKEAMEAAAEL